MRPFCDFFRKHGQCAFDFTIMEPCWIDGFQEWTETLRSKFGYCKSFFTFLRFGAFCFSKLWFFLMDSWTSADLVSNVFPLLTVLHFTLSLQAATPPPVPARKGRPIVTLIPGDGVGPELVYAVQEVFKTTGIPVDFEEIFISEVHHSRSASIEKVLESVRKNNGVALKGAIQSAYTSHSGELESVSIKMPF